MSEREPLARNSMELAETLAKSVLKHGVSRSELLMTSVPPQENLDIRHMFGLFHGVIPLRTRTVKDWPSSVPHLQCLHCGGHCNVGPPLPAARQYDSQNDQYWVYGPFCRPCCAFGYICENDSTSKQLAPTYEVLRRYFGLTKIVVAPPRGAQMRFGGPLTDSEFYGTSGYACLTTLQPPFVTFANYVVGTHLGQVQQGTSVTALLPQSAGALVGLERPKERLAPLAEKKPSGKVPLLLEFLANLTSSKDVKDSTEEVVLKGPKKRVRASEAIEQGAPKEPTMYLKQFVKKTKSET